jgi:beta-barrel assembly-enhancing protease
MTTNSYFRLFTIVFFLFASYFGYAQGRPIQSHGEIPEEFRTLTATKVQKQQAENQQSNRNEQQKKRINEFLLQNNYVIDELLQSGKILFGDSLTSYVNEVAAFLLADDPVLQSQLRFYVMKSNEVNAFATNQGIIFVTIGLLAQLENEGQLAAVLSHEIAHFEKEHSINKVLESDRINRSSSNQRYNRKDSRMRLLSAFSRDMEFEADSLGFIRLVNRGYDEQVALSVLDILQFKMLPIDDIAFEDQYLTLGLTTIPKSLKLDSLTPIPLFDDDDTDIDSTHPNINKRRSRLTEMSEDNTKKGKKYLVNRELFTRVRFLAQHECIRLDLAAQQYIDAFYDAYVLAKKHGDNQGLCEMRAMAMYGISKYKNEGELFDVGPTSEDVYSNIEGIYYFFEEIGKKECNLLAIRHLWDCYEKYKNPFIKKLLDDSFYEIIKKHKVEYDEVLAKLNKLTVKTTPDTPASNNTNTTENNEEEEEEKEEDSKFDRLRQQKETAIQKSMDGAESAGTDANWDEYFVSQMYLNLSRDEIRAKFTEQQAKYDEDVKKEEEWDEMKSYERAKIKIDHNVSKAVFIDPFYVSYDYRKGFELIDSEKANMRLVEQIKSCAGVSGLEQVTLLPKAMEAGATKDYNTMSIMNSWTQEHLAHADSKVEMIPLMTAYTAELADEYGTSHFIYTGTFATRQDRDTDGLWLTTCFLPILLPIALVAELIPIRQTEIYFLVFDVKEGKTIHASDAESKGPTTETKVNSELTKQMKRIQ